MSCLFWGRYLGKLGIMGKKYKDMHAAGTIVITLL